MRSTAQVSRAVLVLYHETARHVTFMGKLARLQIPDNAYKWINNFLDSIATAPDSLDSARQSLKSMQASIIQGSALGPASYVVTAGDLRPLGAMNRLFKCADDTYLVVPAVIIQARATWRYHTLSHGRL